MNGINTTYIQGYADSIIGLINNILVPILISIAFIVFLWGVYKYFISGADDPKAQETGRWFALYGIIGFVILFSVWGIVQIFMGTLNLDATNAPSFPTIGGSGANACYPNPDGSCPAGCKDDFGSDSGCIPISGGAINTQGATYFPGARTYSGSTGGSYITRATRTTVSSGSIPSWCNTCIDVQRGSCNMLTNTCEIGSSGGAQSGSTGRISCGTFFKSLCDPGVTSCTALGFCGEDPSAQYGSDGSCPAGYVADDEAYSGCSPDYGDSQSSTYTGSTDTDASIDDGYDYWNSDDYYTTDDSADDTVDDSSYEAYTPDEPVESVECFYDSDCVYGDVCGPDYTCVSE